MGRSKAGIKDIASSLARIARPSPLACSNRPRGESLGNQAMLRRLTSAAPQLQFKLMIGAVNDPLEAEADRAAEQVMRMSAADLSSTASKETVHRKCAACEDEDKQKIHAKSNGLVPSAAGAPPIVHQVLKSAGQPLDGATREFFEPRFGADLSRVRVHSDQTAAQSAGAINARAYAAGKHIVLGPGAGSGPSNLLAHELAHVLQQSGGQSGEDQIHRAPGKYPDVFTPAFPCDHGAGMELCNFTKDSMNAPRYGECFEASKAIIDDCKGDMSDCKAQSTCALCDCLGNKYCKCTGIV